jgi:GNAT superfamily N-acetyltransferase
MMGTSMATRIVVRPVTASTWDDFVQLFESRGSPHYCWCTVHRFADAHQMDGAAKKAAMRALVKEAVPIGVLAYSAGVAVGWCSVAPRESYVKLRRSRTMARVTDDATPTWVVLCFFVARSARGTGVMRALLRGAVKAARAAGAQVIEGYPHDTAGISSTHRGRSSAFAAAGFVQDGARWVLQGRVTRGARDSAEKSAGRRARPNLPQRRA